MQKIIPLQPGSSGPAVADLQEALRFILEQNIMEKDTYGEVTTWLVQVLQEKYGLETSGVVDEETASVINELLMESGKLTHVEEENTGVVRGYVISHELRGIAGQTVSLFDKNVGAHDVPLDEGVSGEDGAFEIQYTFQDDRKEKLDLQVKVLDDTNKILAVSEVRYNADPEENGLDILIPAEKLPQPVEYSRLLEGLGTQIDTTDVLARLKEDDEQRDITYLANKTGWDARIVAMLTRAHQLAGDSGIEPEFYYALFRAGIPADEAVLSRIEPDMAEQIWNQSIEQQILPAALHKKIPEVLGKLRDFSVDSLLSQPPQIGISSFTDLIQNTLDDAQWNDLARLYTGKRSNLKDFWEAVREKFPEQADRLQLTGKLAFLTINNGPLISRLITDLRSPVDLIDQGFYRQEAWEELLADDLPVPDEIPGETEEEKRVNYGSFMANQLQLSYPTAVVADMIRCNTIPLADEDPAVEEATVAFLKKYQGSFELGVHPVHHFLKTNHIELEASILNQIQKLQRVYQISPSNEAMAGLLKNGFDSARSVLRYDEPTLVRTFSKDLGGESMTRMIYAKSHQVHHITINVAASYFLEKSRLPLYAVDNLPALQNAGGHCDEIISPTLEKIFGEMDYCSCRHCRSWLSPSAYLVDLLKFLDTPNNEKQNPLDVLLQRRPDIQHLQLTCGNTNTVLPYIDLVNEMLEHFVLNRSLQQYKGHNIESGVSTEDLLANPQFVNDKAYEKLRGSKPIFPPPLPFHQPLEALRKYFGHFDLPLHETMERMQAGDRRGQVVKKDSDYGRRDILMERLQISRQEYAILTNSKISLQGLYGENGATVGDLINNLTSIKIPLPDGTDMPRSIGIGNAKLFSRKFNLDYEETIEIACSRFMGSIVLAEPDNNKNICSFDTVEFRYASSGSPDTVLKPVEYLKLVRFIRLWRKLGWSIDRTDNLMTALYPARYYPERTDNYEIAGEKLDKGFAILLMRLAHLQRVMELLHLKPKRDLDALLACWSTIGTQGERSLYRKMFLNPTILEQDEIFKKDGDGGYLVGGAGNTHKLSEHTEALRAAFNLTQKEFDLIIQELEYDSETVLNLETISAIFRHGYLARKMRLSVQDFLALKKMSGIDPFASLGNGQPENNQPFSALRPPIMRFLELAKTVGKSPFKISMLGYLLQHTDPTGQASPPTQDIHGFAQKLRQDLLRIENEYVVQDDPDEESTKTRMTLVYGKEATDLFFGLLNSTSRCSVDYEQAQTKLGKSILQVTNRIQYDDFQKQLSFQGCMTFLEKEALDSLTDTTNGFKAAVQKLFETGQKFFNRYPELLPLHDAYLFFLNLETRISYVHNDQALDKSVITASAGRLSYNNDDNMLCFKGILDKDMVEKIKIVKNIRTEFKQAVDRIYTANQKSIDSLFKQHPDLKDQKSAYLRANDLEEQQRSVLLRAFLPKLCKLHKRLQVRQMVASSVDIDLPIIGSVLEQVSLLHSSRIEDMPVIDDFLDLEFAGLSADIYFAGKVEGNPDKTIPVVPMVDYRKGRLQLPANPAGSVISGVWKGFLETKQNGACNFYIKADAGADIKLEINGKKEKLEENDGVWKNKNRILLEAGQLYEVKLTALKISRRLVMEWESGGMGREVIPALHFYPASSMKFFTESYIRVLKTLTIVEPLALSAKELSYFATDKQFQITGQGWLNMLPGDRSMTAGTVCHDTFRNVLQLLRYCKLKNTFNIRDNTLLEVLRNPETVNEEGISLLYLVTGWAENDLKALLDHFNLKKKDLTLLENFIRVNEGFVVLDKMGIGAIPLLDLITNEPSPDMIRALQSALRARYEYRDWLKVIQPINNSLRGLQRDALMAYVLDKLRKNKTTAAINTPDKLFEYFLTDVQMDSCMKTSRIKQAISSVQLFIQRCLLNLEPDVSPRFIKAGQWKWMNRYRLWEANRKVFLWPENWLEPELRDNKSPFFKELESELLQGDITDDAAATALVHYLEKLEDIAKLEICGMYYEEDDSNKADTIVHVIGRTAGMKRTYFYRRLEGGISWTPWEKIGLNIEDNPVLPVVWKGRFFLFWVTVLKETVASGPSGGQKNIDVTNVSKSDLKSVTDEPKIKVSVMLNWSEYYHGTWQPVRTSDVNAPLVLGNDFGINAFDRNKLKLSSSVSVLEEDNGALVISVNYTDIPIGSYYKLYNTHSLPVRLKDDTGKYSDQELIIGFIQSIIGHGRTFSEHNNSFSISYTESVLQSMLNPGIRSSKKVLTKGIHYNNVQPQHQTSDIFNAPFFCQDTEHVFYVKSEISQITVGGHQDFGMQPSSYEGIKELPDLHVMPQFIRNPHGFYRTKGFVPPKSEEFVHFRSFLHQGTIQKLLTTPDTFRFGDQLITPVGSTAVPNRRR